MNVREMARAQGARCDLCPLRNSEAPAVPPGELPKVHKLTLVGEAPGRTEEKLGRPFAGLSGKLVDEMLTQHARVPRQHTYLTNGALCRGERDEDNKVAARCCAPRVLAELAGTNPAVPIATLGKLSTSSILGINKIFLARGFVWRAPEVDFAQAKKQALKGARGADLRAATLEGRSKLAGRTILPSIHPAFVLRSETWLPILKVDFRRMGRVVRGELKVLADSGSHVTTTDPRRLKALGPVVALDVETTHAAHPALAKLLCVGLSDGVRTVVLWPWEPRLAKPLSVFLRSRKAVVGHNLLTFDKIVLEAHGVK